MWRLFALAVPVIVLLGLLAAFHGSGEASRVILIAILLYAGLLSVTRLPSDPIARRSPVEQAMRSPTPTVPIPAPIRTIRGLLVSGQASAAEFDHRLRPRLELVARERASERGVLDLESALGEEAYRVLSGREGAGMRDPGPSLAEIELVVSAIEELA